MPGPVGSQTDARHVISKPPHLTSSSGFGCPWQRSCREYMLGGWTGSTPFEQKNDQWHRCGDMKRWPNTRPWKLLFSVFLSVCIGFQRFSSVCIGFHRLSSVCIDLHRFLLSVCIGIRFHWFICVDLHWSLSVLI